MRQFRTRIPFLLSLLPFLHAQECDPSRPLGPGCDDSSPGIALNGWIQSCNTILSSCPGGFPTSTDCVKSWCQHGCGDNKNCCASSNPQSCFQGSSSTPQSGSGTGSNSGGASNGGGQSLPTPAASLCSVAENIVHNCESSTSGFLSLPGSQQASCLCFNDGGRGKYNGTVWDDAASTCYSGLVAASMSQSVLSAYTTGAVGACTRFVDAGVLSSAGVSTGGSTGGSAGGSAAPSQTAGAQTGTNTSAGPATSTKSAAEVMDFGLTMLLTGLAVASFVFYAL